MEEERRKQSKEEEREGNRRSKKETSKSFFMGSRLKLYSLSVEFFINLIEPREGWLVRATESMMEIH